jgi:ferrochelatase
MSTKEKVGLLFMAYGTPRKPEEIEPYYTHILRGRKPSPVLLKNLTERYQAIGGVSPLACITDQQVAKVEEYLNSTQDDVTFQAYLGFKHIDPFIEDAVSQMADDDIKTAICIVLAPHYSMLSVKTYHDRARAKAKEFGIHLHCIDSWYKEPKFIQYWAQQLKKTFLQIPQVQQKQSVVIFSAHSLPAHIIERGDPYEQQLKETADLVARAAQIPNYAIGWQSASDNSPFPWLEPDVCDLTRQLYHQKGYQSFIYCPIGFVSDHLEVLYDNDIECKAVCDELQVNYYRTEMPNIHPAFIECLATIIQSERKQKVCVDL